MNKKFFLLIFLLWSGFYLVGCEESTTILAESPIEAVSNENNALPDEKLSYIEAYLKTMTLEEKVGQVFMQAFRYDTDNKRLTSLDENTKNKILKYHLGGVIFFSENIDTIDQTQRLIEAMQQVSRIPLFISVDEEGGIVSRLNSSPNMPATKLPGNKVLGDTENVAFAYKVGRLLGKELTSLGFNMNLAPVADVNTNPQNPVIGERSFGSDPHKTGEMVAQMVKGIQDENISAVVKHFPGHGDTSLDTHKEAVTLPHGIERLKAVEFLPFKKGIEAGVDGVMLGHLLVPSITSDSLPATFSWKVVDLLRNHLKYEKLIITDALEMKAITKYWTPEEAAVLAFAAGADILLMPSSLEKAYEGLLKAVKEGRITEERLNESVRRILNVKYDRGILMEQENLLNPQEVLGSDAHLQIVKDILEYHDR
ncbi:glycoside hydrolase family 3 protein [Clostridium formicaceticum]|uniref:beta-N-acetylhexosaminidase n=1 Tax=Clostridium formicaceticum TaxID=1497 RepID=A0AAC9WFD2_9CLOT|nr:glycoside hydrolase family 3 protein [Clostridium formicaceticum]AOY76394.1 glycoside hydrolase [Clostridium formicaceticum]ARE86787.1 putative lipoprotein YbbD precursor [Clostridium formicaceticum]